MNKYVEVVGAILTEGNKLIVFQRPATKGSPLKWEFPGGKVEKGETKQEALIRECREELAISISVGCEVAQITHFYPDITVHLTVFDCTVISGIITLLEHNAMAEITMAEIDEVDFSPADKEILPTIKEYLCTKFGNTAY